MDEHLMNGGLYFVPRRWVVEALSVSAVSPRPNQRTYQSADSVQTVLSQAKSGDVAVGSAPAHSMALPYSS